MSSDERLTGADDVSVVDRHEDPTAHGAPPHTSWRARALIAVVVLVAIFGFILPQIADYDDAWAVVTDLRSAAILTIGVVGAWNLYTYWPVLKAALPGLQTREAMVVQQASTAIANTVPAGAAVGMAVTFRFLRAWGFTKQAIANQLVAVNMASLVVKLLMPVVALVVLAMAGEVNGALLWLALVGITAAIALGIAAVVALRAEETARNAGLALDRLLERLQPHRRAEHRPTLGTWLLELRHEFIALARREGLRLAALTLVSHISLFAVLLVTLRGVGVGPDDVDWSVVFAAFAFVRLLSALPVTPGGSGVVELGYIGFLTTETSGALAAEITAAVLLFRAVTFVLPLALGSVAWLVFHTATSWRNETDSRGGVEALSDRAPLASHP